MADYGPIPTTLEIQNQIDEIKADPSFSTIRSDVVKGVSAWLDTLNLPPTIIRFGEAVNPKEVIMGSLDSYNF